MCLHVHECVYSQSCIETSRSYPYGCPHILLVIACSCCCARSSFYLVYEYYARWHKQTVQCQYDNIIVSVLELLCMHVVLVEYPCNDRHSLYIYS